MDKQDAPNPSCDHAAHRVELRIASKLARKQVHWAVSRKDRGLANMAGFTIVIIAFSRLVDYVPSSLVAI